MKSKTLLSLGMAVLTLFPLAASAEEVTVDVTNGALYRDGTGNPVTTAGSWCRTWKSTNGLVTFDSNANNMQWNSNHLDARSGSAQSATYTLACDKEYMITGYKMTLTSIGGDTQTWTIDGKTVTTTSTTDAKQVSVSGLTAQSVLMSLAGANTGTLITDFVVTLKSSTATILVDMANGSLTLGTGSTFANTWTSTSEEPQVEFYRDINPDTGERRNDMTANGNDLDLYHGNGDRNWNIRSLTEGYVVTGYEFDFTCTGEAFTVKPAKGGDEVTGSLTETKHVSVSGLEDEETYFTLAGTINNKITTSNFRIYLKAVDKTLTAYDRFVVFDNAKSSVPYRIPAIAVNRSGDVITVADYRYSKADIGMASNGKLDLRFRIKDHETGEWGEVQTLIAARGAGSANIAFGDPCIVADRTSDRVLVTSCCGNVSFPSGSHSNHQGWAHMYSNDGGKTWSEYIDRSEQVFNQLDKRSDGQIRCFFIGSGKILQSTTVKVGEYYRLYCAALVKVGNGTNTNYVFYSDDFGENWNLLGTPDDCPIPSGGDEPKAEELPDGSILVSSRISGGRFYNIYHFTNTLTGEGKWDTMATSNASVNGVIACGGSGCNGETLCLPVERKADGEKMYLLLQSVPLGSGREYVGINYKELDGFGDFRTPLGLAKDWDGRFQISNTTSGYSTMTLDREGAVRFFYEESLYNSGYDMVYKKFSIEEITDSLYAYAPMTAADSAAYLSKAIENGIEAMRDQFGPIVGQYTDEARTILENAQAGYIANPGREAYEAYNGILASLETTAHRVKVEVGKTYYLRNCGRDTETDSYVMTVGATYFEGASDQTADISAAAQHFTFVPVPGADGTYYFYNPERELYFGKLGANETETAPVSTTDNAGTFRIESNTYGQSVLYNENHTGDNQCIHLAGDTRRLVPWGPSLPSQWYIVPVGTTEGIGSITPAPSETVAPASIYDLSGRRVTAPVKGGVYIIGRKKVLVK